MNNLIILAILCLAQHARSTYQKQVNHFAPETSVNCDQKILQEKIQNFNEWFRGHMLRFPEHKCLHHVHHNIFCRLGFHLAEEVNLVVKNGMEDRSLSLLSRWQAWYEHHFENFPDHDLCNAKFPDCGRGIEIFTEFLIEGRNLSRHDAEFSLFKLCWWDKYEGIYHRKIEKQMLKESLQEIAQKLEDLNFEMRCEQVVKNYGTNLDEIKNQLHGEFRQNSSAKQNFLSHFAMEGLMVMKAVAIQKHNESSKSGASTGTKESENTNENSNIELCTGFSEESVQKIIDSDSSPIEKEIFFQSEIYEDVEQCENCQQNQFGGNQDESAVSKNLRNANESIFDNRATIQAQLISAQNDQQPLNYQQLSSGETCKQLSDEMKQAENGESENKFEIDVKTESSDRQDKQNETSKQAKALQNEEIRPQLDSFDTVKRKNASFQAGNMNSAVENILNFDEQKNMKILKNAANPERLENPNRLKYSVKEKKIKKKPVPPSNTFCKIGHEDEEKKKVKKEFLGKEFYSTDGQKNDQIEFEPINEKQISQFDIHMQKKHEAILCDLNSVKDVWSKRMFCEREPNWKLQEKAMMLCMEIQEPMLKQMEKIKSENVQEILKELKFMKARYVSKIKKKENKRGIIQNMLQVKNDPFTISGVSTEHLKQIPETLWKIAHESEQNFESLHALTAEEQSHLKLQMNEEMKRLDRSWFVNTNLKQKLKNIGASLMTKIEILENIRLESKKLRDKLQNSIQKISECKIIDLVSQFDECMFRMKTNKSKRLPELSQIFKICNDFLTSLILAETEMKTIFAFESNVLGNKLTVWKQIEGILSEIETEESYCVDVEETQLVPRNQAPCPMCFVVKELEIASDIAFPLMYALADFTSQPESNDTLLVNLASEIFIMVTGLVFWCDLLVVSNCKQRMGLRTSPHVRFLRNMMFLVGVYLTFNGPLKMFLEFGKIYFVLNLLVLMYHESESKKRKPTTSETENKEINPTPHEEKSKLKSSVRKNRNKLTLVSAKNDRIPTKNIQDVCPQATKWIESVEIRKRGWEYASELLSVGIFLLNIFVPEVHREVKQILKWRVLFKMAWVGLAMSSLMLIGTFLCCLVDQCSDDPVIPDKYPKNIFLNRAGPTRKLIRIILFYILLHQALPSLVPSDSVFAQTFINIIVYFAALLFKFFKPYVFPTPWPSCFRSYYQ